MRAQKELFEYEIDVERRALAEFPDAEQKELRDLFVSRGIAQELADRLSADLMKDPDLALRTHAREELGVDPSATGSPWAAATSSLGSFAVGAFLPLIPWLVTSKGNPVVWSLVLGALGSAGVGASIGWFTKRGTLTWALRQMVVTALAAGVTFGVGSLIGTH
jgi:VIT1/CCC1 family predicted Fe2+/Mn2+ transporter